MSKYRYIIRLYNFVNILFEIRYIIVDDVGYYVGGLIVDFVWLGGGVVLIVFGKLFFFIVFGLFKIKFK